MCECHTMCRILGMAHRYYIMSESCRDTLCGGSRQTHNSTSTHRCNMNIHTVTYHHRNNTSHLTGTMAMQWASLTTATTTTTSTTSTATMATTTAIRQGQPHASEEANASAARERVLMVSTTSSMMLASGKTLPTCPARAPGLRARKEKATPAAVGR